MMCYKDILTDYHQSIGTVLDRIYNITERNLLANNKQYQLLQKEINELELQYPCIIELFEFSRPNKNYSDNECEAIAKYIRLKENQDFFQYFEAYKLGMYDIVAMKMNLDCFKEFDKESEL